MNDVLQIDLPGPLISEFCRKWKIAELSLFGSVLRDDFCEESDIDVLVTFSEDAEWSLFDYVDMREELKEIFGRDIDLVEESSLRNPFRRIEILNTKRIVYVSQI
jgi:uncharacterized protein